MSAYHTLRETFDWQLGAVGSPEVDASAMFGVTFVRYGNGPLPGMTSAPAHWSLGGASRTTRSWTAVWPDGGAAAPCFQTTT